MTHTQTSYMNRSGVRGDQSFTLWEYGFSPFSSCDLHIRQGFRKLSSDRETAEIISYTYTMPLREWSITFLFQTCILCSPDAGLFCIIHAFIFVFMGLGLRAIHGMAQRLLQNVPK